MDFVDNFVGAQERISRTLVETVRSATRVSGEDTTFHRSLDSSVGNAIDVQNSRLLSIAQKLLHNCSGGASVENVNIRDVESIDSNWRALVDVVDNLLERTDSCLDEYNGLVKQPSPGQQLRSPAPSAHVSKKRPFSRIQNIPKPQATFDERPTNNESGPFKPLITKKPHASVPLEQSLRLAYNDDGLEQYHHPYSNEISHYQYPTYVYRKSDPIPYNSFNDSTAVFVEDLDGVSLMLEELKRASVIAVDLEHHDTHSYAGIVSLMQISTRDQDWIIDTLKPWRRKLEVLNEVFANPDILKVLHGAQMDIIWLQRDLGIYVVGLFDTHHASRVLGYESGSLAFLLKKFVDFDAQKQYQTADWRIRPLPMEMFEYARSDTHFLLYIFDKLRNELTDASKFSAPDGNKVQDVLEKSKETALQRYEYARYDEERGLGRGGWFALLQRTPALLSKEQFRVFRKVHQWRDEVARREDESVFQIMANHVLFNIARSLPDDTATLLGVSHPISHYMRNRVDELLTVVRSAKAGAANDAEVSDVLTQISREGGRLQSSSRENLHIGKDNVTITEPLRSTVTASPADYQAQTSTFWHSTIDDLADLNRRSVGPSSIKGTIPLLPDCTFHAFHSSTSGAVASLGTDQKFVPVPNARNDMEKQPSPTSELDESNSEDVVTNEGLLMADTQQQDLPLNDERSILDEVRNRVGKKAATRGNRGRAPNSGRNGQTIVPFDYNSAPSVLHAAARGHASQVPSKRPQPEFNPYSKASDTSSGVRKAHRPKGDRSHTFKQ